MSSAQDGTWYRGETNAQGLPHGRGRCRLPDGSGGHDEYDGEWRDGHQEGRGRYTWSTGDTYEGDWLNKQRHGRGVQVFADSGNKYDGKWEHDVKCGLGTLVLASGDVYRGMWQGDLKHGEGEYVWANGDKYVGGWRDDMRNGHGTMTLSNGDTYEGNWLNDCKHGLGTYTWADGFKYSGYWRNDEQSQAPPIVVAPPKGKPAPGGPDSRALASPQGEQKAAPQKPADDQVRHARSASSCGSQKTLRKPQAFKQISRPAPKLFHPMPKSDVKLPAEPEPKKRPLPRHHPAPSLMPHVLMLEKIDFNRPVTQKPLPKPPSPAKETLFSQLMSTNVENPFRVIAAKPPRENHAEEIDVVTAGAKVVCPAMMPITIKPAKPLFGLGSHLAPVGKAITDTLCLTNPSKHRCSFRFVSRPSLKWEVTVDPASASIAAGKSVSVVVSLTCTSASVTPQIAVVVWPKNKEERCACWVPVELESALTTKLDPDELSVYRDPIGDGAYGTVWRGDYRGIDVAIKMIKHQDLLTDQMLKDFQSEVSVMEGIRNPRVVGFIGAVHVPNFLSIVTEFCEYGTLGNALAKKIAPWDLRLKCMLDCARAMMFLHASYILHRDIKPDNLLLVSFDAKSPVVCKIADFGTSRDLSRLSTKLDCTKGIGTPLYMAPEILKGADYDQRADVFSYGITMCHTVAQEAPFKNDPEIVNSLKFAEYIIEGKARACLRIRCNC
eukprot:m51a1_g5500 putative tyrosine protein kinase (721) ;mRNA; r:355924-358483